METLAYLHLALAYEVPVTIKPVYPLGSLKIFKQLGWRNSSHGLTYLLSLAIALSVLGMANQALAVLKQGDRGPEVRTLQQQLRERGYFNRRPNGIFGSRTKRAVIRFQEANNLRPDGIVGQETAAALFDERPQPINQDVYDEGSRRNSLQRGDRGSDVAELQQQLQDQGVYSGAVDGIFGSSTEQAVEQFQRSRNLFPDGKAGPQTLAALESNIDYPDTLPYQEFNRPAPSSFTSYESDDTNRTTLRFGDRGADVERLQRRLREERFYRGSIDGIFGSETQRAVRRFQISRDISPANGVAGLQTLVALDLSNPIAKRYEVVVPVRNTSTLGNVRQYVPRASERPSRLGKYVNAGNFSDRQLAENLSKSLRSRGLDARVVYSK